MEKLKNNSLKILDFIYKYRYLILLIIFAFCIIFEISGSSIGCWNYFIDSGIKADDGIFYGKSRTIRSDEWAVFTPMMFSQKFNGFKYFSTALRGTATDVFMIYGLPVLNLMQIFRPFQIGFLFLGLSRGLSFFWIGRLLALFIISFEFSMILTKKDKVLSFIGTMLITFSAQVQWWFAVNGTAELFIFGQLALILLYKYMNDQNFKKRILYLFGLIICAGGYILILYPAWQVPLFYVFLALAIGIVIENFKNCKISKKDIFAIIVAILIFITCMGYIFYKSFDTIKTVTSTVYPGARISRGGGAGYKYFAYPMNIFLPEKEVDLRDSSSESSVMFGLFPIGIIISIYAMIKNKKTDIFLICLSIAYLLLSFYCITGIPEILAKITMLSNSISERAFIAIGFLDILILLRGLSVLEKSPKIWVSLLITIVVGAVICIFCKYTNRKYISKIMALEMCIMTAGMIFGAIQYKSKYGRIFFGVLSTVVMILVGGRVNPIRKGIDTVYKSPIIAEIQKINEDEGKWLVESIPFPIQNYVLMAGASVINSTNTYPDLEKWNKIDVDKKYEDVYNRYAHINAKLYNDNSEFANKFELLIPDTFLVNLVPEDLKTMDIRYVFTTSIISDYDTDEIKFEFKSSCNGFLIYEVIYK